MIRTSGNLCRAYNICAIASRKYRVKALSRYVILGAVVVLIFWGARYLFPPSPASETAQLHCVFTALQPSHPVPIPISTDRQREVDFKAGLTGKSLQDGNVLWHARYRKSVV